MMTLKDLLPGQKAVVVSLSSQGELGRRLRDMGITPGAEMEMLRYAPLKDPIAYRLSGCVLALRKKEAEKILVKPLFFVDKNEVKKYVLIN